jgi:hypothetical protein
LLGIILVFDLLISSGTCTLNFSNEDYVQSIFSPSYIVYKIEVVNKRYGTNLNVQDKQYNIIPHHLSHSKVAYILPHTTWAKNGKVDRRISLQHKWKVALVY